MIWTSCDDIASIPENSQAKIRNHHNGGSLITMVTSSKFTKSSPSFEYISAPLNNLKWTSCRAWRVWVWTKWRADEVTEHRAQGADSNSGDCWNHDPQALTTTGSLLVQSWRLNLGNSMSELSRDILAGRQATCLALSVPLRQRQMIHHKPSIYDSYGATMGQYWAVLGLNEMIVRFAKSSVSSRIFSTLPTGQAEYRALRVPTLFTLVAMGRGILSCSWWVD